jgi:hypothetical protein
VRAGDSNLKDWWWRESGGEATLPC